MTYFAIPMAVVFLVGRRFRNSQEFHRVAIFSSGGLAFVGGLAAIALALLAAISGTRAIVSLIACFALGAALTVIGLMALRQTIRGGTRDHRAVMLA